MLLAGVWARPPTRPGEGVEGSGGSRWGKLLSWSLENTGGDGVEETWRWSQG